MNLVLSGNDLSIKMLLLAEVGPVVIVVDVVIKVVGLGMVVMVAVVVIVVVVVVPMVFFGLDDAITTTWIST